MWLTWIQGGQPVVDTAVAQQVADEWQAAPVIGMLSSAVVQQIVASAQATAQRAVLHSPGQQQVMHIDGTPADSIRTGSDQGPAFGSSPAAAGAERGSLASGAEVSSSNAGSSSHSDSSGNDGSSPDRSAGGNAADAASLASDVNTVWAAVSSALLRRIPQQLAATLQRLQQKRAVRHLEASLVASGNPAAQVSLLPKTGTLVATYSTSRPQHAGGNSAPLHAYHSIGPINHRRSSVGGCGTCWPTSCRGRPTASRCCSIRWTMLTSACLSPLV